MLAAIKAEAWASGHPSLGDSYFHEFLPLVKFRGGVKRFASAFEFDRFDVDPDHGLPAQKAYLDRLLRTARDSRQVAVFKFCRSMGRMPWLMRAFPEAAHVVVLRSPASQWSSYWGQYKKFQNAWFLAAPYRVLGRNLETPKVLRAIDALGCDARSLERLAFQTEEAASASVQRLPVEANYRVHLAHWVLCMLSLDKNLDAVLDSDMLAHSRPYGLESAEVLARVTGLKPDFSDAKPTDTGKFLCSASASAEPDELEDMDPSRIAELHRQASVFAERELGEAGQFARSIIVSKLEQATLQILTGDLASMVRG